MKSTSKDVDADKICRAILYQVKRAKTLKEAIDAVEIVAGENNVALVDKKLAESE